MRSVHLVIRTCVCMVWSDLLNLSLSLGVCMPVRVEKRNLLDEGLSYYVNSKLVNRKADDREREAEREREGLFVL